MAKIQLKQKSIQKQAVDPATKQEIDPKTGKPVTPESKEEIDPQTGQTKKPTEDVKEADVRRQLNQNKKKFNPGSDVTPNAGDLAKDMSGGENTPKPNSTEGAGAGQGKDFKPGGGATDPAQFDAQKKPGAEGGAGGEPAKNGGAMQKAGDMAKGAMDKGKAASDAVKQKVDAAKQAAKNVKDKITAPAKKLGAMKDAAKDAISDFMDSINPIKKFKELSKDFKRLIPVIARMLSDMSGFGLAVAWADKTLRKENVDKMLTCGCCCGCLVQIGIIFGPVIIILLLLGSL